MSSVCGSGLEDMEQNLHVPDHATKTLCLPGKAGLVNPSAAERHRALTLGNSNSNQ